jgi:hypothetical protein
MTLSLFASKNTVFSPSLFSFYQQVNNPLGLSVIGAAYSGENHQGILVAKPSTIYPEPLDHIE